MGVILVHVYDMASRGGWYRCSLFVVSRLESSPCVVRKGVMKNK